MGVRLNETAAERRDNIDDSDPTPAAGIPRPRLSWIHRISAHAAAKHPSLDGDRDLIERAYHREIATAELIAYTLTDDEIHAALDQIGVE